MIVHVVCECVMNEDLMCVCLVFFAERDVGVHIGTSDSDSSDDD